MYEGLKIPVLLNGLFIMSRQLLRLDLFLIRRDTVKTCFKNVLRHDTLLKYTTLWHCEVADVILRLQTLKTVLLLRIGGNVPDIVTFLS